MHAFCMALYETKMSMDLHALLDDSSKHGNLYITQMFYHTNNNFEMYSFFFHQHGTHVRENLPVTVLTKLLIGILKFEM